VNHNNFTAVSLWAKHNQKGGRLSWTDSSVCFCLAFCFWSHSLWLV